ncbi:hypothetical protein [Pollutibacter soli]|uniref:hypothetical protein n=1 Tax=Pollutibacter soli TaxID=3034157 RepID=UPI003013F175
MAKYSRWIGIISFLLLVAACFMPWAYYADLDKNFTGFYSEKNIYGAPGKFLLITAGISVLFTMLPAVWMKRVAIFTSAVNVAYAIVVYLRFSACYQGYCPEIKAGLLLMMVSVVLILTACLFPAGKINPEDQNAIVVKEEKA